MTEMIESREITRWLGKNENLDLLKKIAAKVLYQLKARCLEHYLMLDISSDDPNDQIAEVTSHLIEFISRKKTVQDILFSGEKSMANAVKRSFVNDVIDTSRKTDLFKKLNRNCQAALRNSTAFSYQSDSRAGFFFYKKSSDPPRKVLLFDDDLKAIPFPFEICETIDYKFVNRKKMLIRLADWFYDQVEQLTEEKSLLIEMNVFVKWIGMTTVLSWQVESMDTETANKNSDTTDLRQRFFPEIIAAADQEDKIEAEKCATAFAHRIPEIEKQVFFLFYCENLDHKQVRKKMGRTSSLAYHKKKAETRLKEFLAPFSWGSVESMMKLFLERLCRHLCVY